MTTAVSTNDEDECQNCGMIDVPLVDGHCIGCTCASCGRTAEDAGGSMTDLGWCGRCEEKLRAASPQEAAS
jgi:hypothetical protein